MPVAAPRFFACMTPPEGNRRGGRAPYLYSKPKPPRGRFGSIYWFTSNHPEAQGEFFDPLVQKQMEAETHWARWVEPGFTGRVWKERWRYHILVSRQGREVHFQRYWTLKELIEDTLPRWRQSV